jgi:hypothetical protein
MEVSDLVYIPVVVTSGKKRAVTIGYELARWAPEPVSTLWRREKKGLAFAGKRTALFWP